MRTQKDIIDFIKSEPWIMGLLKAHQHLDAPDSWIAAGAIRNPIWAKLHGVRFNPALENDVDVIYFNPSDITRAPEAAYEIRLKTLIPDMNWQVRNQARMHIPNQDAPYKDSFEALEHWAETATAIGARMVRGEVELIAPYGVDDLLGLIVRQTPKFIDKREIYENRIQAKQWRAKWPGLTII